MKNLIASFLIILCLPTQSNAFTRFDITQMAKKNHVALEYKEVKKVMFSIVDNIDGVICSVYTPSQCKKRYQQKEKNFKINIEHTWPQSKGAKELPANSDMHHLFLTSKESNSKRANLPFCNAAYDYWQMDGSIQGFDDYAQDCFEPQDGHKGNVARAMFYFAVRYDFSIDKDQEETLRAWNKLDPVDERELKRNEIIKSLQGNINPFILKPEWIDEISNF
ncbi:endonuclease I family protein [Halobacteriovorax sp. GFR7]|uniref:endonuclease I family protein n=1 Tax=unclassified Halobacteriovorax TaxID=2639665 RepID=UPI003D962187